MSDFIKFDFDNNTIETKNGTMSDLELKDKRTAILKAAKLRETSLNDVADIFNNLFNGSLAYNDLGAAIKEIEKQEKEEIEQEHRQYILETIESVIKAEDTAAKGYIKLATDNANITEEQIDLFIKSIYDSIKNISTEKAERYYIDSLTDLS